MVFDDYWWKLDEPQSIESPKAGIDAFLHMYQGSYVVVNSGYQLWILKTAE